MGTKCFYEEKTTIKLRIKGPILYEYTHHSKIRAVPLGKAAGQVRSIRVRYKKTGGRFCYVKGTHARDFMVRFSQFFGIIQ
jgi:hypothetical protein